jgi:hypothetical protein
MTIKVIDYTHSDRAVSAANGEDIYAKIALCFENNENVNLDFEGIKITITAFQNACIGNLYANFETEKIKNLLTISNLNNDELPLLKLVIDEAKKRFGRENNQNDLLDETNN